MKILLIGYGKMGKAIEKIALERGHEIVGRIDRDNTSEIGLVKADAAIEFSQPEVAFENIKKCLNAGIPVISGTTGWLQHKAEVEKLTHSCNGTFFYASNFSIGVNIFFRLNEYLASAMKTLTHYNVNIDEIHHTEKKDAPSGTAITLAEGILKHLSAKKKWVNEPSENREELIIHSFREGNVPGTHVVTYHSEIDDIEIKHTAHSREGFARGAVIVAEWIQGKRGVLSMNDFLQF